METTPAIAGLEADEKHGPHTSCDIRSTHGVRIMRPMATILGRCLRRARVGTLLTAIVVGACGGDSPPPVGPEAPDTVVVSIEVAPSHQTIGVLGTYVEIGAAALGADGETLYGSIGAPGRFSWTSTASEVAAVVEDVHPITGRQVRLIRGLTAGTAEIMATSQGVIGRATVTVHDRARAAWSVSIGTGSIDAGIAIGADGTIYVGTNEYGAHDSRWFALSPEGAVLWSLDLARTGSSTPAIGADGALYIGTGSTDALPGRLVAVNPDGTMRWVLEDVEGIRSSPAIGPDGAIYAAGGHHLYAVDPGGIPRWIYANTSQVFAFSSPAVASDGTIYVGGTDGALYAIDHNGSLRWSFGTSGIIQSSPSIGADGTIYVGSLDGRLYAIDPEGIEIWSLELDWRGVSASPSIGPDGTIYVSAGALYAVDPGGSVRWSYRSPVWTTTPILGADGTIYLAHSTSRGGALSAIDHLGNLHWTYPTGRHSMGSPAIGGDGMIVSTSYSDSHEAVVHGILETAVSNGGAGGAPWPQVRGRRGNTGRAGG